MPICHKAKPTHQVCILLSIACQRSYHKDRNPCKSSSSLDICQASKEGQDNILDKFLELSTSSVPLVHQTGIFALPSAGGSMDAHSRGRRGRMTMQRNTPGGPSDMNSSGVSTGIAIFAL
eukprot:scaffold18311_cov54-Attheya_sp.AAC.1